jgi:ribonuclease HI
MNSNSPPVQPGNGKPGLWAGLPKLNGACCFRGQRDKETHSDVGSQAQAAPGCTITSAGACMRNPGGAGGWAVVRRCGADAQEYTGYLSRTTNNESELRAILEGLRTLPAQSRVAVRSCSQCALWSIRKALRIRLGQRCKQPVHPQICFAIADIVALHRVEFSWVSSHGGDSDYRRAVALARMTAKSGRELA